jgi:hypothetical protein
MDRLVRTPRRAGRVITCWPDLYRVREGRIATDSALLARVASPRSYASKGDVPRWAGAEFRDGYRSLASFRRSSWLVLDFDQGAELAGILDAFGDLCGFAHTTWTPGRWRVGLMLSRVLPTVDEHDRVWRAGAALAEAHGLEPDRAARTAAHCFALPARHAGDAYQHVELTGALLDVAAALATFPAPEPLPEPERAERRGSYAHRLDRARAYLEKMPGAISGSGGHAATFKAAVAMVRGFGLEPDDALRLLIEIHNPLCAPPWSLGELRHKVRQAFQRARLPFGALADRPRRTA